MELDITYDYDTEHFDAEKAELTLMQNSLVTEALDGITDGLGDCMEQIRETVDRMSDYHKNRQTYLEEMKDIKYEMRRMRNSTLFFSLCSTAFFIGAFAANDHSPLSYTALAAGIVAALLTACSGRALYLIGLDAYACTEAWHEVHIIGRVLIAATVCRLTHTANEDYVKSFIEAKNTSRPIAVLTAH